MLYEYSDFNIEVTRKKVKNLNLRIRDGKATMSVPPFVSDAEIDRFVREHYRAIYNALQKQSLEPKEELKNGGSISIFGERLQIVINYDRRRSIERQNGFIYMTVKPEDSSERIKKELDAYLTRILHIRIAERLKVFEPMMNLYCSGFQIKSMKSRWGSCNTRTGKLNFNLKLVDYTPECLDYVIIHELAHIREHNHSKAFWRIVERYCPDYKQIRKHLNAR